MNTHTIAEAKQMVGQVVPRIEARLTKIYDRKEGSGEYGPYSFQNGEIEDATGSMKIVFSNVPDQSDLLEDRLVFKSMPTKHGLKGVEVKANEYKGKTTIELKVSKVALVVKSDEEGQEQPEKPSQSHPQAKKPIQKQDVKLTMATARNRLTQLAGLYEACYRTATSMDSLPDTMAMNEVKDIASCLFIQGIKEGLADCFPIRSEKTLENPTTETQNEDSEADPDKF